MNSDELPNAKSGNSPGNPAGYACPNCGTLLYSRRARMCGACGAVLPPEFVLSDGAVEARQKEREWARDLADKFDPSGPGTSASAKAPTSAGSPVDLSEVEATLRRLSCASEFKYRKRPTWFYVAGCLATFVPVVVLLMLSHRYFHASSETWIALGVLGGMNALSWFWMWHNAMPICPNCHQNIRLCPIEYCYGCGRRLKFSRCTDCGIDNSWTGWLDPYGNGTWMRIAHCPSCGVELDSWVRRLACARLTDFSAGWTRASQPVSRCAFTCTEAISHYVSSDESYDARGGCPWDLGDDGHWIRSIGRSWLSAGLSAKCFAVQISRDASAL